MTKRRKKKTVVVAKRGVPAIRRRIRLRRPSRQLFSGRLRSRRAIADLSKIQAGGRCGSTVISTISSYAKGRQIPNRGMQSNIIFFGYVRLWPHLSGADRFS